MKKTPVTIKIAFVLILLAGLGTSVHYFSLFLSNVTNDIAITNFPNIAVMGLAITLIMSAYFIRAMNFKNLITVIRPTDNKTIFSAMSIGFMCNAILPFRIGEIVRAYVLGTDISVSRIVILLLVLFERSIDCIALSLYALVLFYSGKQSGMIFHQSYAAISTLVLVAGITILVILWLIASQQRWLLLAIYKTSSLFNNQVRDKVRHTAWSAIYGLNIVYRNAPRSRYISYAILMWAIYIVAIAMLAGTLFGEASILQMQILSASSYLSVAVPSGPGYFGTFHYYLSSNSTSVLNGITDSNLLYVFTFLVWLVFLLPITTIGVVNLANRLRVKKNNRLTTANPMLNKLYREKDISQELSHFLDEYFSCTELSRQINQYEIVGELRLIETLKGGSNAKTIILSRLDGTKIVRKVSLLQNANKLENQYEWFKSRRDLSNLPDIIEEFKDDISYHYDMKYCQDYVPFFDFIHSSPVSESVNILRDVINFMSASIYVGGSQVNAKGKLVKYINEKVYQKVNDAALLNSQISAFLRNEKILINGIEYDNLFYSLDEIQKNEEMMSDLYNYWSVPIHGDLTIDNILVNREKRFILIDPNDENYISTPLVDLAKLYQSLHSGYEFINRLEVVDINNSEIAFDETKSLKYHEIFHTLEKEIESHPMINVRAILFHEAVHYCRMLTYKCRINPKTAPAYYAIAARLFCQFRAQYD